jgi:type 1 glutamine amidotransferase
MIQTLLLTGENNHDWRRSAPFCRDLLTRSGKFAVDLTETPDEVLADAAGLDRYGLFFVDYHGAMWGDRAKANFEAAVRAGAGVVILHASNNGFEGWTEYERMVALAWREGTGHGQFHEFPVTITDKEHPVTRGVADFRTWDELYHRLAVTPGVHYDVLATAYSAPETGGTGRDEPMMIALTYGRGRIFHQILGHVWPGDPAQKGSTMIALENPGFQTTLLRGAEWAATGAVTEGKS